MKVYGDRKSGNCYKVGLLASLLGLEYDWVDVDTLQGGTSTPEFLRRNPHGKTPTVELDTGEFLSESNAILYYLARDSDFFPQDKLEQARVLRWQFFEQNSHEPNIAVARFIALYQGVPDERRAEYESKQPGGHRALGIMERQLQDTPFLAGDRCTIADISLYAYTHVADEGGFDLAGYPAIRAWFARVEGLPGFVAMNAPGA